MQLTFLGTGGGRFTMLKQLRQTGGMVLEDGGFSMCIDPGPGALVHAREQDMALEELDALLVTHAHLDHCGDMHAIIEAMTDDGTAERGQLLCSQSVVEGTDIPERYTSGEGTYGTHIDRALDSYHRSLVEQVHVLADDTRDIGPYTLRSITTQHSDPTTIAFRLEQDGFVAGFVSDTQLFDGLMDFLDGCDALVVNMTRPREKAWKGHLNTTDTAELLAATRPDLAVVQHFGAALIYASVADEVEWLQEQVSCDVVAAADGTTIDLETPEQGLERFL